MIEQYEIRVVIVLIRNEARDCYALKHCLIFSVCMVKKNAITIFIIFVNIHGVSVESLILYMNLYMK